MSAPDTERVMHAVTALMRHRAGKGQPLNIRDEDVIIDLLVDLHHLSAKAGFDLDRLAADALQRYLADLGWTKGGRQ